MPTLPVLPKIVTFLLPPYSKSKVSVNRQRGKRVKEHGPCDEHDSGAKDDSVPQNFPQNWDQHKNGAGNDARLYVG